jgi:predicted enzyme related to lactoylglutathione lyase
MSQPRPARFGFLKLVVRDLQQEARFYRSVVGYCEGLYIEGEIAGRPIEEIFFSGPNGESEMLILAYKDGAGPPPSPSGVITGLFTPDIEAFEARVLEAGGRVVQPIGPIDMPGGVSRLAFYADPEGYLLEVIET